MVQEVRKEDGAADEPRNGKGVRPSQRPRFDKSEHHSGDAEGAGEGADHVEVAVVTLGLDEDHPAEQPHRHPDRHVDEHHPTPRDQLGQQAAGHESCGAAGSRHRGVETNGADPLLSFRERGGEEGEGTGCSQRRAQALDGPGPEERPPGDRQAADERAHGEDPDAEQEHPAAAEQVARPGSQQEEASEREDVGVDDPREGSRGEAQAPLDVREGDVDDRGVQHHHELGGEDHPEENGGATGTPRGPRTRRNVRRRRGTPGLRARRGSGGLGH